MACKRDNLGSKTRHKSRAEGKKHSRLSQNSSKPYICWFRKIFKINLHNFDPFWLSKWFQNCVCQGPRPHALKLGTSMGQKKDPTEIAYGFLFRKMIKLQQWSELLIGVATQPIALVKFKFQAGTGCSTSQYLFIVAFPELILHEYLSHKKRRWSAIYF